MLFCGVFLVASLRLAGQDTAVYQVSYAGTGSVNRTTNGNAFLLSNGLKFGFRKKNSVLNASSAFVYGKQNDVLTNEDFSSTLDFNMVRETKRLYYWGLLNYDKSYSLRILDRLQSGIGLGYTLVNTPTFSLVLSDGPLYENISLSDTSYQTLRNSFRVKYRLHIGRLLTMDGTNFLQNSLLDRSDYVIRASNNLSFRLNTWLAITASSVYNRLNINARENLLLTFGVKVDKIF